MLSGAVPRIYARWWRPALGRLAKGAFGPSMADEHRIARLLLALSPGDGVLDVACGTGSFCRDFGRTVGPTGLVVGIDVSPDDAQTGSRRDNAEQHRLRARRRPGTPLSRRELRRRLLLRRVSSVRRPDAGARPHDGGAYAGRPHRDPSPRPATAQRPCGRRSRCSPCAAARGSSRSTSWWTR